MADPGYEYVALQTIEHGGVAAYRAGDLVPADNVKANGYEVGVQVKKRDLPKVDKDEKPAPALVPPKATANKAEWVDFFVDKLGQSREDAEAMTKEQLVEHFATG
jgi:hypothetical protein